MLKQLWMGVFLVLMVAAPSTGIANEASAVGSYQASLEGVELNVILHTNGTATFQGEVSQWMQLPGQLVFTDSSGERLLATYDGTSFSLTEGGITLVFRRIGAAASSQPASTRSIAQPPARYKAGKLLKGKTYRVKGANASFTLPKGFTAREGEHEGQAGIIIGDRRNPTGLVVIIPKLLSAQEMQQRVSGLLRAAARDLVGDTPVQVVVSPQDFHLKKHEAGYLELSGQQNGQRLRAKIGGIRIERWGAVFLALYPANEDAKYAGVFDTIFTTFKAKPPKENKRLAGQIAGCWETVSSSGGGTGSSYSETRYQFGRDGSYRYQYMMSVSIPNGGGTSNRSDGAGSFAVYGNEVTTTDSRTGESSSFSARLQRGFLLINGNRYTPCS